MSAKSAPHCVGDQGEVRIACPDFISKSVANFISKSMADSLAESMANFISESVANFISDSMANFISKSMADSLAESMANFISKPVPVCHRNTISSLPCFSSPSHFFCLFAHIILLDL
jgi:hypothetical protein